MGRTQLKSNQIGQIQRNDIDITTSGESLIRKILIGSGLSMTWTGADAGTGDVTLILTGSTGGGVTDGDKGDVEVSNSGATWSIDNTLKTNWDAAYTHVSNTSNPHSVTKSQVGLGSVENTALSTWTGTANITTLGTIATGVWNGTAIGDTYISSAATWNAKQNALTFSNGLTSASGTVKLGGTLTENIELLFGSANIDKSIKIGYSDANNPHQTISYFEQINNTISLYSKSIVSESICQVNPTEIVLDYKLGIDDATNRITLDSDGILFYSELNVTESFFTTLKIDTTGISLSSTTAGANRYTGSGNKLIYLDNDGLLVRSTIDPANVLISTANITLTNDADKTISVANNATQIGRNLTISGGSSSYGDGANTAGDLYLKGGNLTGGFNAGGDVFIDAGTGTDGPGGVYINSNVTNSIVTIGSLTGTGNRLMTLASTGQLVRSTIDPANIATFPTQTSNANKFLYTNGTSTAWGSFSNGLTSASGTVKLGGTLTDDTNLLYYTTDVNKSIKIGYSGTVNSHFEQVNNTVKLHVTESTGNEYYSTVLVDTDGVKLTTFGGAGGSNYIDILSNSSIVINSTGGDSQGLTVNGVMKISGLSGTGDRLMQLSSTGQLVRSTIDPANVLISTTNISLSNDADKTISVVNNATQIGRNLTISGGSSSYGAGANTAGSLYLTGGNLTGGFNPGGNVFIDAGTGTDGPGGIYINSIVTNSIVTIGNLSGTGNRLMQLSSTGLLVRSTVDPATLAVFPTQTGNTNSFLTTNGSTVSWVGINQISYLDDGVYAGFDKLQTKLFAVTSFGDSWVSRDSNRNRTGVAISSDGKWQAASASTDFIYVSSDYGATWSAKSSSRAWVGIAMSRDGKYMTGVVDNISNGYIYISSDYGETWTQKESIRLWRSISMSVDGKYQVAGIHDGGISVSSDYGVTWTYRSTPYGSYTAVSADGKYILGAKQSNSLYVSSDYGTTWSTRDSSRTWRGCAMSASGKFMTAVVQGGFIYISSDYGVTWTQKAASLSWANVVMSSDGKYQMASLFSGTTFYISTDYGNTWSSKVATSDPYYIAMSSDASWILTTTSSGTCYTSNSTHTSNTILSFSTLSGTGNRLLQLDTNGKLERSTVDPATLATFPTQTGQSGKFLTTNGTVVSWGALAVSNLSDFPSQTSNSGKVLSTNGTTLSWTTPAVAGGTTWTEITGTSQTIVVDNGYIANNAAEVVFTLPATAAIGKEILIMGKGAGGWRVSQLASQQIHFGNRSSTVGTGGYISSTHRRDTVRLICITANTEWQVMNAQGNLNII